MDIVPCRVDRGYIMSQSRHVSVLSFFLFWVLLQKQYTSLSKQKHGELTYSRPGDSREKHKAEQRS